MTTLPIPAIALEDCGAILGRRGAGKSATKTLFFEHELDAGHRCCLIDPKGDGYGVRLNPDGSPSRFQNVPIFGGAHGDMALDERQGAQLGKLIAEHDLSCVVDLSGFASVAAMRRFARDFAEALFQANTQPLTLFVDEADQLAPQNSSARQDGPVAMLLHHMEALIRQGRQRGIFMWMLTQRPQVLNKNLLSQAETLVAMKMTTPHDRKAIRDWMDAHDPDKAKEVEHQLASLGVGEAFVWVPAADFLERVQFPLFSTYDSGRTPRRGETINRVELPPIDLAAVREAMAIEDSDEPDTASPADGGAVKKLRARIAALEAERDEWAVERGYGQQQIDALVAENRALREVAARIGAAVSDMARIKPALEHDPAGNSESTEKEPGTTETTARLRVTPIAERRADTAEQAQGRQVAMARRDTGSLPTGARKLIDALAKHYPRALPIEHAAKIGGVSMKSSQWPTNFRAFRESGMAKPFVVDGQWELTTAGRDAFGLAGKPDDPAALLAFWVGALPPSSGNMLKVLVTEGDWLAREEIADRAGVSRTSSALGSGLKELRDHGLAEQNAAGAHRATKVLL